MATSAVRGQAHINVKTVERATSFVEDAKKKPISLGGEPISVDYSILWPQQPSTTLRYRGWTLPVGELEKALAPHKAVIQSISPRSLLSCFWICTMLILCFG